MPSLPITTSLTATITTAIGIADMTGYTAAKVAVATRATITTRTTGLMITWSGTTPSATVGHLVAVNTNFVLEGQANIAALKLIQESGGNAVTTITLESD